MKTIPVFFLIMALLFTAGVSSGQNTFKIGVLAKNGPVKAMKMWKSTGDYLTHTIQKAKFEIIPLDFDDVNPYIESKKVDFFLVNSSMFVTAKVKYESMAIATMINSRQGQPLKSFGGVIFTSIENDKINTITDLKGKTFMAVKQSSFGGWQMAYKEILDSGINPFKDFAKFEFGGKHDNVVYAVQNGLVEAGTVRTDTLERMAASFGIDMAEFKIIRPKKYATFPFVVSTPLYPEWPFAKVSHVSDEIANKVAQALKKVKSTDKCAKDAKVVGWDIALDYSPVENLQKTLKIGAYK